MISMGFYSVGLVKLHCLVSVLMFFVWRSCRPWCSWSVPCLIIWNASRTKFFNCSFSAWPFDQVWNFLKINFPLYWLLIYLSFSNLYVNNKLPNLQFLWVKVIINMSNGDSSVFISHSCVFYELLGVRNCLTFLTSKFSKQFIVFDILCRHVFSNIYA